MANLPDFITSNTPVSKDDRISWAKGIAPAYAGIMLWYAFWQYLINLGNTKDASAAILSQGVGVALAALAVAAAICFIFFYYVPGMLGMTTGRPLSVIGTSVFGARGGFILPGFLMGLLQFGWLSVNATTASILLWQCFTSDFNTEPTEIVQKQLFWIIAVVFIILAVFMAYKGMKLVGFIGQFAVLIPIAAMILLLIPTFKGVGNFKPDMIDAAAAVEKKVPAEEAPANPAAGQDASNALDEVAAAAKQAAADVKEGAAAVGEDIGEAAKDAVAAGKETLEDVKEGAAAVGEDVAAAAKEAKADGEVTLSDVKEGAAAVAEDVADAAKETAADVKEGAAAVAEDVAEAAKDAVAAGKETLSDVKDGATAVAEDVAAAAKDAVAAGKEALAAGKEDVAADNGDANTVKEGDAKPAEPAGPMTCGRFSLALLLMLPGSSQLLALLALTSPLTLGASLTLFGADSSASLLRPLLQARLRSLRLPARTARELKALPATTRLP